LKIEIATDQMRKREFPCANADGEAVNARAKAVNARMEAANAEAANARAEAANARVEADEAEADEARATAANARVEADEADAQADEADEKADKANEIVSKCRTSVTHWGEEMFSNGCSHPGALYIAVNPDVKLDTIIEFLQTNGKSVEYLNFDKWPNVNDDLMKLIAEHCTNLKVLSIKGSKSVTVDGFLQVRKQCKAFCRIMFSHTNFNLTWGKIAKKLDPDLGHILPFC
jgi:hypothetical protein